VRLDPRTNETVAVTSVPGTGYATSVVTGFGSVWVSTGDSIVRVDSATNKVVAVIRVGSSLKGLTTGDGFVWVTKSLRHRGEALRIDPATNRVAGPPLAVGSVPTSPLIVSGALWVVDVGRGDSLMRVNLTTGQVAATGQALSGPIVFGDGAIWGPSRGFVKRIDPHDPREGISVPVRGAVNVAIADGSVWVLCLYSPVHVLRIDPATNKVVSGSVNLSGALPTSLSASRGSVWAILGDMSIVFRIDLRGYGR
jgi:streptogramin lyase